MSLLCDFPKYQAQLDYWLAKIRHYEARGRMVTESDQKTMYQDMIIRLHAKIEELQEQLGQRLPGAS